MNLISREAVLALLAAHPAEQWALAFRAEIERLPYFPAPNPTSAYDRNALGQTEDEFWNLVDSQPASAASDPRGLGLGSSLPNFSARVEGFSLALVEPVARCP